MRVAGLRNTHHTDDNNAGNRNQTQPHGPIPTASSALK
ncbi:hypothetical protein EDE15_4097 [Edaphobacter aggregans]|uniref:Uncharacterized protein n=1 Tax=Edaphobacter aggregans TaxID=570835 RepID=A0A428MNM1_9BACT|nr:hypothetical protein EDE15_4097 [Edaphobacter aggregans]